MDLARRVAQRHKDAVIRKEKGEFCVRSPDNPTWNGGCFKSEGEAEKRLKQVEWFKKNKDATLHHTGKNIVDDRYKVVSTELALALDAMNRLRSTLMEWGWAQPSDKSFVSEYKKVSDDVGKLFSRSMRKYYGVE